MTKIQQTQANKRRGKNAPEIEHRAEVVELVGKHIEEVEALEKRRYHTKETEARSELFAGGLSYGGGGEVSGLRSVAINMADTPGGVRPATETELPDIETQEGLAQLQRTDEQLDTQLEEISEGVLSLRHLALDIREEVRLQSVMVDEITTKVDGAHDHLHNINKKMKSALTQVRSGDRFILDFIMIIVILGIGTYCYNMFSAREARGGARGAARREARRRARRTASDRALTRVSRVRARTVRCPFLAVGKA
jgi:hypothetical protein